MNFELTVWSGETACGVVTVAVLPVPRDKTTSLGVSRGQMRSHSHSAMLMGLLCRKAPSWNLPTPEILVGGKKLKGQ